MATDYILAGSTGLVGTEILKQLTDRPDTGNIFALGRKPPEIKNAKLHFVQFDFESPLTWPQGKPANPVAICTLGTTIRIAGSQEAFRKVDFDFVLRFAEEAKKLGAVSVHVVTAHGASAKSGIFYNRVKGEIEEKLQSLGLSSLHIYRPSLLLGDRKEHRPGEGIATFAVKMLSPVFKLPGLNAVQPTPADKLAAYILATGSKPGNHVHSNAEVMRA